jgi:hypothetical protein
MDVAKSWDSGERFGAQPSSQVALSELALAVGISDLAEHPASRKFNDVVGGRQINIIWNKHATIPSDESFALRMATFRHGLNDSSNPGNAARVFRRTVRAAYIAQNISMSAEP